MIKPVGIEKILWIKPGIGMGASGVIPKEADFFKDHTPGFPILSGVLALEMLRLSAEWYLREKGYGVHHRFVFKKLRNVKFSYYLKPGDVWESRVELVSDQNQEFAWNGQILYEGQIAVSARFTILVTSVPLGVMI